MEYNKCKFGVYIKFCHDNIPLRKHNKEIDEIKREINNKNRKLLRRIMRSK